MNKHAFIYCKLIWKKGLAILPRFFITLAVTALALAGAGFVLYSATGDSSVLPGIDVALVTEGNDPTIKMGAGIVQNMESVRAVCRFHEVSEEEAVAGLKSGRYQAAAYLPEDLYEDVNSGVNTPVKVQVASGSLLSVSMFKDLIDVAMTMLQTGESAVYALYDAAEVYETNKKVPSVTGQIAVKYLGLALQRAAAYNVKVISPYGETGLPVFYTVTGILAAICILFGVSFSSLYKKESPVVRKCLARTGVRDAAGVFARLSVVTAVLWGLLVVTCFIVSRFADFAVFRASTMLQLLPVAFSLAAFMHMIYSFASGESGSLVYLLVSLLVFVLGGGLFPASFLPEVLAAVPKYLPIQLWQRVLTGAFAGESAAEAVRLTLVYGIVMIVVGVLGAKAAEKTAERN